MMTTIIGLDLAKESFALCGISARGGKTFTKTLRRQELLGFLAQTPKAVVAMEACAGSNFFAKKISELGHEAKIIPAQYVKPFLKHQKNDLNDAFAIAEAASREGMRFVAPKAQWQQDLQCLHRARARIQRNKTSLINQIRALLLEYGVMIPFGVGAFDREIPIILEDDGSQLTPLLRELTVDLYQEYLELKVRLESYQKKLEGLSKSNEVCTRLQKIPGVGPLSATAFVAAVGDANYFENGRQVAAWLGLVPRQHSTGGRTVLLGITKRGDVYLRSLLVHGARAVLASGLRTRKQTDLAKRAERIVHQSAYNKAVIAIANRNARVMWAMMKTGEEYKVA